MATPMASRTLAHARGAGTHHGRKTHACLCGGVFLKFRESPPGGGREGGRKRREEMRVRGG